MIDIIIFTAAVLFVLAAPFWFNSRRVEKKDIPAPERRAEGRDMQDKLTKAHAWLP